MGKLTISTGPFSIAMLVYQRVHSDHYLPGFSHKLPSHHRHYRSAILGSPWLLAWHLRDLSRRRSTVLPDACGKSVCFFNMANLVAITRHSIGKCSFRFIWKSELSRNCYLNESKLRIIINLNNLNGPCNPCSMAMRHEQWPLGVPACRVVKTFTHGCKNWDLALKLHEKRRQQPEIIKKKGWHGLSNKKCWTSTR